MSDLIPFESAASLPAKRTAIANPFAVVKGAGGYPVISIKGGKFHVQRGDERTLITKGDDGEPAFSIELVIVAANPNKSKVFYREGYIEGSSEKPTCYSNDGLAPAADSTEKQASKCAMCPRNVWGGKVTEAGAKTKECSDSLRLAVAPAGQINDLMLLRVPAGSFKAIGTYGDIIGKKGYLPHQLVTKVGFDHTVAHPSLTFKPLSVIPDGSDMAAEVAKAATLDIVKQIIGTMAADVAVEHEEFVPPPAPEKKVAEAAAKVIEKAAKKLDSDDLPKAPKAKVKVESKADLADQVGEMVESSDDLDFDD